MNLELDRIRAFYAQKYNNIFKGIGRGDKIARTVIEAWIEAMQKVVVVWGPPGSGKSTIVPLLDEPNTMVVETTGLNKTMNKFFLSLPRNQVDFVHVVDTPKTCRERVSSRKNNPLQPLDNGPGYVTMLVDKWFDTAQNALPIDEVY